MCDRCNELEEERDAARAVAAATMRQNNALLDAGRTLMNLFVWITSGGKTQRPAQGDVSRAANLIGSYRA